MSLLRVVQLENSHSEMCRLEKCLGTRKERVVFRGRTSAPSSMSYVTFPELGRETGIKAGGLQPRTAVSKILSVRICLSWFFIWKVTLEVDL